MARQRTWLEWLNPLSRVERWFNLAAILWLGFAATVLYAAFTREGVNLPVLLSFYLLFTVAGSVVAFVLYASDKRRAVKEQPRISERTLHIVALIGGWPGAQLARSLFRHKTLKVSFRIVFWLTVCLHVVVIVYGIVSGWWLVGIRALIGK